MSFGKFSFKLSCMGVSSVRPNQDTNASQKISLDFEVAWGLLLRDWESKGKLQHSMKQQHDITLQ